MSGNIVDLDERRAQFVEEISKFISDRRPAERLTRLQLGDLGGMAALQAQRQSLLDNLSHFYRLNPAADAAPGVLALITIYSDNSDGACTLSSVRMARFLSRSERTIRETIKRLEESQTIFVERNPGRTSYLSPWVHESFGAIKDPITWILDARAPAAQPGKPGRPRKAEVVEIPRQQPSEVISGNTPAAGFRGNPANGKIPRKQGSKYPGNLSSDDTTNNTTDDEVSNARTRAIVGVEISEEQLEAFNQIYNFWGSRPDAIIPSIADRKTTDRLLLSELEVHADVESTILHRALVAALNTIQAVHLGERAQPTRAATGGAAALSYFRKVLGSEINRLRLEGASLEASARSEQAILTERHKNRMNGVSRAANGKSRVRPSWDEAGKSVWGDTETEFEQ